VKVRVVLPTPLQALAKVGAELEVEAGDVPTVASVLDALEARYPMLRGTMRDQATRRRRAFIRFYACEADLSHDPTDAPLPAPVVARAEPLLVVGAMAGG
jgi:sulfur-carrier protein